MRILELRAENVKRLSVVQITPEGHLVQITGGNGNGKTSVLDAIWMALGGADAVPDKPIRKGAKAAKVEVKLGDNDGVRLVVQRTFTDKGTYLTVRGADGAKYGSPDKMLKDLMGAIGFDPLSFMHMKDKEQFEMLRRLVKLDVDLEALDRRRATIFEDRTGVNRDLGSAKARAAAIIVPPDLPEEAPDVAALTNRLAEAADHNQRVADKHRMLADARGELAESEAELERLLQQVEAHKSAIAAARADLQEQEKEVIPEPIDTAKVRAEIEAANIVAEGFRRQAAKIAADGEVTTLERSSNEKTEAIAAIDATKKTALGNAKMPIEGLSFEDGTVTFNGLPLAQASASQQLRVSTAIGAALNPKLRVILARDGSLLDSKSLAALAAFAEEKDMQIFLERVDESGEVGIVMEDGHIKGQEALVAEHEAAEAAAPATAEGAAAEGAQAPDSDAEKRAKSYLDAMVKKLPTHLELGTLDADNAAVKVKLARFPTLISTEWTPHYLERVKYLSKKK